MAYPITLSVNLADYGGDGVTQGSVSFELSGPMYDTVANKIIAPKKEVVDLTAGVGTISLPATKNDSDVSPTGLTYKVRVVISPSIDIGWEIELDKDLGAAQSLADLPPASHITTNTYALISQLTTHENATTSVHGIPDTAQLATLADLDGLASAADVTTALAVKADTSTVTTELATKQDVLGFTPLAPANNLSDVATPATARANLGLGSSATHAASDFETPSGALDKADAAQSTAQTYADSAVTTHTADTTSVHGIADTSDLLLASNNLSDVTAATARTNLGVPATTDLASTSDSARGDALIGVKSTLTGGTARTVHSKFGDIVCLADFGVTGSGDESTAIQSAIDAVIGARAILWVNPGTYTHGTTLNYDEYLTIIGPGKERATFSYTGSGRAWQPRNGRVDATPSRTQWVHLSGFTISGSSSATHGLDLFGVQKSRFDNLRIAGFTSGIGLNLEGWRDTPPSNSSAACQLNQFYSVDVYGCEVNVDFVNGGVAVGTTNDYLGYGGDNHFHGGWISALDNSGTDIGIRIQADCCRNTFHGVSIYHATTDLIQCDGKWNEFHGCQVEFSAGNGIHFDSNSRYNAVYGGIVVDSNISGTTVLDDTGGNYIVAVGTAGSGDFGSSSESTFRIPGSPTFSGDPTFSGNPTLRTITVGASGSTIKQIKAGTVAIDPPNLTVNATTAVTWTLTGAAVGDRVSMEIPSSFADDILIKTARVTADDTVTVYLYNTAGGDIDPGNAVWNYLWFDLT